MTFDELIKQNPDIAKRTTSAADWLDRIYKQAMTPNDVSGFAPGVGGLDPLYDTIKNRVGGDASQWRLAEVKGKMYLVDPSGNVAQEYDRHIADPTRRLLEFGIGSLGMLGGIGALGLPLTPGAAAAGGAAAGGAGGATGAAIGGEAIGGATLGGDALLGAMTPEGWGMLGGEALTGSTIGGGMLAGGAAGGAGSSLVNSAAGLLSNPLVKGGLTLAGAAAGAQKQPGATTMNNKLDPRMDKMLYDGLLPAAQQWFNANKSGVNPVMQKGWDMQLGLLGDPKIMGELNSMRERFAKPVPVAGNPFLKR